MSSISWLPESTPDTVLSTDLNSLGTATGTAGLVTNANGDIYFDAELLVKFAAARATGTVAAELYLYPSVDNSNTITDTILPTEAKIGQWITRNPSTSAFDRIILRGFICPPTNFQLLVKNVSGVAFASTGNTLRILRYRLQVS